MTLSGLAVLIGCALAAAPQASGAGTKTYSAQCPDKKTVTVDAPNVGAMSKYKDYKVLVCAACLVADCSGTRLFRGFGKRDDGDRVKLTSHLQDLALKTYGSDEREVSYKCPGAREAQRVSCYTSQSMKECLVAQCEPCRASNCEVYAGNVRVSSGKVAVSRGVYLVDTKASKSETLQRSLDRIKKLASSEKTKGLASSVGAAILANKAEILKLGKIMGISEASAKTVDQIIRMGDSFYAKDVNGGLKALSELTGRPLSQDEERDIERNLQDGELDLGGLSSVLEEQRRRVLRDQDLYQQSFWDKHGTHVVLGGAAVSVACILACVMCCFLSARRRKPVRIVTHELAGMRADNALGREIASPI